MLPLNTPGVIWTPTWCMEWIYILRGKVSKIEIQKLKWDEFHTLAGKVPKTKVYGLNKIAFIV